ncbi:MAG: NTP transferase domain-containing protein [Coriobacteriales bacterium]|jgi:CTP:molybdopterin cytidylyltransferase MocA|nr:NTP transferase domain-containing protein [Coriobacteriales bacterium]
MSSLHKSGREALSLVVLAAGRGSRFGGLKQFTPAGPNGEALLEYSIFDAIRSGFDRLVVLLRHTENQDFETALRERLSGQIELRFAYQDDFAQEQGLARSKPWGTAHAILCAAQQTAGSFAVINADDYYGKNTIRTIADFLQSGHASQSSHELGQEADRGHEAGGLREADRSHGMVAFPLENTVSTHGDVTRGVCRLDERGLLVSIEETVISPTDEGLRGRRLSDGQTSIVPPKTPVSMNIWGFRPSITAIIEKAWAEFLQDNRHNDDAEFLIPAVVHDAIKSGAATCRVLQTQDAWFGVTYRDDLAKVRTAIAQLHADGLYPTPLF